nr:hypothetical protein Iba_chr09cCG13490 [Ipomoea batatas]
MFSEAMDKLTVTMKRDVPLLDKWESTSISLAIILSQFCELEDFLEARRVASMIEDLDLMETELSIDGDVIVNRVPREDAAFEMFRRDSDRVKGAPSLSSDLELYNGEILLFYGIFQL